MPPLLMPIRLQSIMTITKILLEELRKIESGNWQKVYKDGYDSNYTLSIN